jgi:hypothetical protein
VAIGIVCLSGGLSGCARPVHVWEAHAYATPVPPSLDISALGREPILALIPATYNQLQGHIPMVAHALAAACSQTEPKLNLRSEYEIFNTVNHHQAGLQYAEADPTFAASGLLAPTRLKELGAALGAKYVLQPGLVYIKEDLEDKFEVAGFTSQSHNNGTLVTAMGRTDRSILDGSVRRSDRCGRIVGRRRNGAFS